MLNKAQSSPTTTRPGLPPLKISFQFKIFREVLVSKLLNRN